MGRIYPGVALKTILLTTFAAFACLAPADLRSEVMMPCVNVVMVHGILNTGKIFDPMARVLENKGYHCFAPSLRPNDCRCGIHAMALQLSDDIDARFGKSRPIFLVGFSMGGLVARDYVQNLAAPNRVRGAFLISTPENGTFWASLAPNGGVNQLSLNSLFIRSLDKDGQAWQHIPACSYWTPCDLMVCQRPVHAGPWERTRKSSACCILG